MESERSIEMGQGRNTFTEEDGPKAVYVEACVRGSNGEGQGVFLFRVSKERGGEGGNGGNVSECVKRFLDKGEKKVPQREKNGGGGGGHSWEGKRGEEENLMSDKPRGCRESSQG